MWALLVTLAFTLYMVGMIWCMQILEYPLFALVGAKEFPAYHARHNRGLVFVVGPSLVAFISAIVLAVQRPPAIPFWASITVAVLDLLVVGFTALREAPLHGQLDREGYSAAVIRSLVQGNWVRTILWTASALLLLGMAAQLLFTAKT